MRASSRYRAALGAAAAPGVGEEPGSGASDRGQATTTTTIAMTRARASTAGAVRTRRLRLGRGGSAGVASAGASSPSRRTANRRQSPDTPFRACVPRSSRPIPDPSTRSRTVPETNTSPAPARAAIRAPMCTPIPPGLSPTWTASPTWTPARIWMPRGRTASTIAQAHRIARAGLGNEAKKPSPALSTSRPPWRRSSRRTVAWWRSSTSAHRSSPMATACVVESTMSVNRMAAGMRSPRPRSARSGIRRAIGGPRGRCRRGGRLRRG